MKNRFLTLALAGVIAFTPLTAQAQTNHLTKRGGVYWNTVTNADGTTTTIKETWYDLRMNTVISNMRRLGFDEETYPYWVDPDTGLKMLGEYVIIAANLKTYPRGSVVPTSFGIDGLVCDTGSLASQHIDIACDWS